MIEFVELRNILK